MRPHAAAPVIVCLLLAALAARADLPLCASWGDADGFAIWGDSISSSMRLENRTAAPLTTTCALPAPASNYTVAVRTRNLHSNPSRGYRPAARTGISPFYGLQLTSIAGDTLRAMLAVKCMESPLDNEEIPVLDIFLTGSDNKRLHQQIELKRPIHLTDEATLRISAYRGRLSVAAGTQEPLEIWSMPEAAFTADSLAYILNPGAAIQVHRGTILCYPAPDNTVLADLESRMAETAHSYDPIEGEWIYLDRTMDDKLLRMGGRYKLFIGKMPDSAEYGIYYLGGAEIRPGFWQRGMLKGKLIPSGAGRYQLLWRDVDGIWLTHNLSAVTEDIGILTLIFPYQQSSLRLRRIN